MNEFSLENKVALITGASRGIGEAIAMLLSKYGAHCILVSRKTEGLEGVAAKVRASGGKADIIACNTGYPDQIEALYKTVEEKFGRLDILINNAATNPHFGEMLDADIGIWDKTLDVNLKGPFLMIKYAVPLMVKSGGGAVVNVASVNGIRPGLLQGVYSVTKAALISMTHVFAKELAAKKIRVNALLPGLTETKFASAITGNAEISKYVTSQIPLGRVAQPEEMAGAVLFLVSNASSYTTGSSLICDGGLLV